MTEDLREAFPYFLGQAQELGRRYRTIDDLFLGSEDILAAMNATAPGFFRELLLVYQEAILLGMARLVDPPQFRRGKPNLSVSRFVQELSSQGLANDEMAIRADAMKAIADRTSLADFRNRWLAHADEQSAIERKAFELPAWADVREFLVHLEALTREIGQALDVKVVRALCARTTPLHAKHFTEYLKQASSHKIDPSIFDAMTETMTNGR